ncbi:MAG: hypothetical protein DMG60_11880 [Acidobacteria bacterium]|nr:MAG: hypothetical protein DMG60_11880 [Acidobacteriota bacterium]
MGRRAALLPGFPITDNLNRFHNSQLSCYRENQAKYKLILQTPSDRGERLRLSLQWQQVSASLSESPAHPMRLVL